MKKISMFTCLLVLSLNLIGCGHYATPTSTTVTATVTQPSGDLIKISKLNLTYDAEMKSTKIIGQATNNNKVECNFDFDVICLNKDGTPKATGNVEVTDIKPGETKYFNGIVEDNDVTKLNYKIQFDKFFTYTK